MDIFMTQEIVNIAAICVSLILAFILVVWGCFRYFRNIDSHILNWKLSRRIKAEEKEITRLRSELNNKKKEENQS